jgi:hypothetical protein
MENNKRASLTLFTAFNNVHISQQLQKVQCQQAWPLSNSFVSVRALFFTHSNRIASFCVDSVLLLCIPETGRPCRNLLALTKIFPPTWLKFKPPCFYVKFGVYVKV